MKYFIKTFGCQQNLTDSGRIENAFQARGMTKASSIKEADYVIINTCMVRRSAEDRVYGMVINLNKIKKKRSLKIIVTGCMVGIAARDTTGKYLQKLKERMPEVDEFMPIEEVGFDNPAVQTDPNTGFVVISNGCNNFCTYCVVPFSRGKEVSRPYKDIINECLELKKRGYRMVTLLGQNVNSYGSDLLLNGAKIPVLNDLGGNPINRKGKGSHGVKNAVSSEVKDFKPVYVKHLGKHRIPTLFPHLLEEVAKMGFEKVDFMSSNPWDFSDELIGVIAKYPNITRTIHLPIQSGDDEVLKRMNRWYTTKEYLDLISKIKDQISNVKFTTDIIVGFCGETDEEFENTYKLCKKVGFEKAYVARYSPRPQTAATKNLIDDVPPAVKKKRWLKLDSLIFKPIRNQK
ncbi:MAG: radical SAM protein [Candidatus Roizmanbacteria bacterium]|nr:MAG: radical SAM protein [Candidatus Roizmanbacteria bacterium]